MVLLELQLNGFARQATRLMLVQLVAAMLH